MTEFRKPTAACSSNAVRLLKNMRQILTKGQEEMQFCVFNEKNLAVFLALEMYFHSFDWGQFLFPQCFFGPKMYDTYYS